MVNVASGTQLTLNIGSFHSTESRSGDEVFCLRIVSCDVQMSRPLEGVDLMYSDVASSTAPLYQVPVIRILGTTQTGQKACMHVHQCFPYIYVPVPANMPCDVDMCEQYLQQMSVSINRALTLAMMHKKTMQNTNSENINTNTNTSNPPKFSRQYVFKLEIVRGKDFYGYCPDWKQFIKIQLLNPYVVSTLVTLLQGGAIMGTIFQPHESHVPFLLQFFLDYNLFGMDFIRIRDVRFRHPLPDRVSPQHYTAQTIPHCFQWPVSIETSFQKVSKCDLECDVWAFDIINRADLHKTSNGTLVRSLTAIWEQEHLRRQEKGQSMQLASSAESQRNPALLDNTWTSQDRFISLIKQRIQQFHASLSASLSSSHPETPETISSTTPNELPFPTAFEAIDKPHNFEFIKTLSRAEAERSPGTAEYYLSQSQRAAVSLENTTLNDDISSTQPVVDESMILSGQLPVDTGADADPYMDLADLEDDALVDVLASVRNKPTDNDPKQTDELDDIDDDDIDDDFLRNLHLSQFQINDSIPQLDGASDDISDGMMTDCDEAVISSSPPRPRPPPPSHVLKQNIARKRTIAQLNFDVEPPPSPSLSVASPKKSQSPQKRRKFATTPKGPSHQSQRGTLEPISSPCKNMSSRPGGRGAVSVSDITKQLSPRKKTSVQGQNIAVMCNPSATTRKSTTVTMMDAVNSTLKPNRQFTALMSTFAPKRSKPIKLNLPLRIQSEAPNVIDVDGMDANFEDDIVWDDFDDLSLPSTPASAPVATPVAPPMPLPEIWTDPLRHSPKLEWSAGRLPSRAPVWRNGFSGLPEPPQNFFSRVTKSNSRPKHSKSQKKYLRDRRTCLEAAFNVDMEYIPDTCMPQLCDSPTPTPVPLPTPMPTPNPDISTDEDLDSHQGMDIDVLNPATDLGGDRSPAHIYPFPVSEGHSVFVLSKIPPPSPARTSIAFIQKHTIPHYTVPSTHTSIGGVSSRKTTVTVPQDLIAQDTDVTVSWGSVPTDISVLNLPEFRSCLHGGVALSTKRKYTAKSLDRLDRNAVPKSGWWTPVRRPPPASHAVRPVQIGKKEHPSSIKLACASQIESSPQNPFGFKSSQILLPTDSSVNIFAPSQRAVRAPDPHTMQHISVLSMEIQVRTRGQLNADPAKDHIQAIFYCLFSDSEEETCYFKTNGYHPGYHVGCFLVGDGTGASTYKMKGYHVQYATSERDLLIMFARLVSEKMDPDILVGYEIQMSSWGYLIERAARIYNMNYSMMLSRFIPTENNQRVDDEGDVVKYYETHSSSVTVPGRIVLNIWRLMRHEIALTSYSYESVAFQILGQRLPKFTLSSLTTWFGEDNPSQVASNNTSSRSSSSLPSQRNRWRVLRYHFDRVQKVLEMIDKCDIIGKTSEFARVYGIDFYSVISRGSQYRVESMMLRIAKSESLIALSASRQQVSQQNAPECLALVMEPESRFYTDPVIVLDFQSLYPSVMIAYNYCYSTCLGRVDSNSGKFGVTDYALSDELLSKLHAKDLITVSPNGVMFVKKDVREGVLGRMLTEILETRVMVKSSMKLNKDNKALLKMFEAKQLGLKLIANVTYGYTSASFSGRMPCIDIADAIVQTGRETLEKTIAFINSNKEWNARVVYGDTDSVFVLVPGATKERAFLVGKEMAEAITARNPVPMKLKFEKVYHPSFLLSKKRYVGQKFESLDDKGVIDAKGIETIRRDGCPAVRKTMEQCLKIMFSTQNLSEAKHYLQRQWTKIQLNKVSIQDFILAKEVKMGKYSGKGPPPPGAHISAKAMTIDPRAEPQYGERVPYVIVYRGPKDRVVDCAVRPDELLWQGDLRLNAEYYITKQIIPALARLFGVMGVDVASWYTEMPRHDRSHLRNAVAAISLQKGQENAQSKKSNGTIDQYYCSDRCIVCGKSTPTVICTECRTSDRTTAVLYLASEINRVEHRYLNIRTICQSCVRPFGTSATAVADNNKNISNNITTTACVLDDIECVSMDCEIAYERTKAAQNARALVPMYQKLLSELQQAEEESDARQAFLNT